MKLLIIKFLYFHSSNARTQFKTVSRTYKYEIVCVGCSSTTFIWADYWHHFYYAPIYIYIYLFIVSLNILNIVTQDNLSLKRVNFKALFHFHTGLQDHVWYSQFQEGSQFFHEWVLITKSYRLGIWINFGNLFMRSICEPLIAW